MRARALLIASSLVFIASISLVQCGSKPACEYAYTEIVNWMKRCHNDLTVPETVTDDKGKTTTACFPLQQPGTPGLGSRTNEGFNNCARDLANASCDSLPRSCSTIVGTLDAGAPCATDVQCNTGNCARNPKAKPSYCGVCRATLPAGMACKESRDCNVDLACVGGACVPSKGNVNDPCASTGDCRAPNHCDVTSMKCASPIDENKPCKKPFECKIGLTCTSGLCVKPLGLGAACTTGTDCAPGYVCDELGTSRCVKAVFAGPGEKCDGITILCRKSTCRSVDADDAGATTFLCPTIAAENEGCDPNNRKIECDTFTSCWDGKCQIPNPANCP